VDIYNDERKARMYVGSSLDDTFLADWRASNNSTGTVQFNNIVTRQDNSLVNYLATMTLSKYFEGHMHMLRGTGSLAFLPAS